MSTTPRTTVTLADVAPELARAQLRFQEVAYPGVVDLVTRELVRIQSGRLSNCSICRNLRLDAAVRRGFDEAMVADLDAAEPTVLTPRQRAAVRLTNAFLLDPCSFGPHDRAELLRHFTCEEVAELLLDLLRFRPGSKLTVAGGFEPADDELVYV